MDRDALLAWGEDVRRALPWRDTRDPWAILVSEVMLQQTQVDRVVPRWRRFLRRYPTAAVCAAAPLSEILTEWQGLGYPRRARNLHRAAGLCVTEHGGTLPDELEALLALPGVGPYTARAVLAFAFERDVGVVDTNVGRILARQTGAPVRPAEAQRLADEWVPGGEGWAWNQTTLDLGALLCRPTAPRCEECPVRGSCAWRGTGPDPASGSAAVSRRQAPFAGSLRQRRGEVLRRLGDGPVPADELDAEVLASLADDGLAVVDGAVARLPTVDGLGPER